MMMMLTLAAWVGVAIAEAVLALSLFAIRAGFCALRVFSIFVALVRHCGRGVVIEARCDRFNRMVCKNENCKAKRG